MGRLVKGSSAALDQEPDAFDFTDVTAQAFNTLITSDSVNITGINAATPVTISGDGSPQFRINGGAWGTTGNITNGQSLELRLTSANADTTMRSATVDVGGVTNQWDVTTQDKTPAGLTFTDVTGQALNTVITSNSATITGITGSVAVSVSGDGSPEVRINGGSWVGSGTITNGQSLEVRLTSSGSNSTMRSATVTVGSGSDQWDVTTLASFANTKSVLFGGTNEYYRVTDHASLDITANLTLSAWVKGAGSGDGAGIVSKDDYGANQRSYDLFKDVSAPSKIAGAVSADGTNVKYLQSSLTAFDDTWHHVAMTFSSNTVKLYVDGTLDPSPVTIVANTVNSIHSGSAAVTIGTILNSDAPSTYTFTGNIDEPSIWNATLTDAEIAEIYNSGDPTDLTTHSKAGNLVSWWRMGDDAGDSNTALVDQVGSNDAVGNNLESGDVEEDVP